MTMGRMPGCLLNKSILWDGLPQEVESWSDEGRMKRNVMLSANRAPPNSMKSPTKEVIKEWYNGASLDHCVQLLLVVIMSKMIMIFP